MDVLERPAVCNVKEEESSNRVPVVGSGDGPASQGATTVLSYSCVNICALRKLHYHHPVYPAEFWAREGHSGNVLGLSSLCYLELVI